MAVWTQTQLKPRPNRGSLNGGTDEFVHIRWLFERAFPPGFGMADTSLRVGGRQACHLRRLSCPAGEPGRTPLAMSSTDASSSPRTAPSNRASHCRSAGFLMSLGRLRSSSLVNSRLAQSKAQGGTTGRDRWDLCGGRSDSTSKDWPPCGSRCCGASVNRRNWR